MKLIEITSAVIFKLEKTKDGHKVTANLGSKVIGSANIRRHPNGQYFGTSLHVDPEHRRRGIATKMYDYVEQQLHTKLKPAFIDSDEGEAFWKARQAHTDK